jgi:AcrR family transcriptional regulator
LLTERAGIAVLSVDYRVAHAVGSKFWTRRLTCDCKFSVVTYARELFARSGIHQTSIRAVAAAAGVDQALVHHYFGTKEQLFAAAIRIPIDPMEVIGPLRETPVEEIGYKLAALLLPLWDSELGSGFIAALRSMLASSEESLFRSFLQEGVVDGRSENEHSHVSAPGRHA